MLKILVPVNGSECALKAVDAAIRDALEHGHASIQLLNVQPFMTRHVSRFVGAGACEAMRLDRARAAMAVAARRVRSAGIPCSTHMARGHIAAAIAGFARRESPDRIVIGAQPAAGLGWRGRLVDQLIKLTPVPVQSVSGGRRGWAERVGLPAGLAGGLAVVWLASE